MKLFSGTSKPTWATLTQNRANLSGVSVDFVQMRQITGLDKCISQLEKMKSFKPDSKSLLNAIELLTASKSQINDVIQRSVTKLSQVDQNDPSTLEEGLSFNRRA